MLITPIFNGQGLGNQLACYVTTKCIALDKGYDFGVVYPERFKGFFFKNIDLPKVDNVEFAIEGEPPIKMPDDFEYYREETSDYDPFVFNIPDNYVLHGNLQGVKYFEKYKEDIDKWLEVEPRVMPDDLCVINFRGGEYVGVSSFFLPKSYWDNAIENMKKINPDMQFEVHTDDPETAKIFFPDYPVIHDIEFNWRSIRYAKYLILSNSSFALLPAWLNDDAKLIIAPKYFARFNHDYWFLEQNFVEKFKYQDKHGNLGGK